MNDSTMLTELPETKTVGGKVATSMVLMLDT